MTEGHWSAAEAKAKLSEVMAKAESEGPQRIRRNGRPAVVVVADAEWERMKSKRSAIEVLTDPKYGVLDRDEVETLFARDRTPDRPAPEF